MDWNGDGKHDWKDDAFYNNIIDNNSNNNSSGHNYGNNTTGSNGWVVFGVIIFIVYVIAKILGFPLINSNSVI